MCPANCSPYAFYWFPDDAPDTLVAPAKLPKLILYPELSAAFPDGFDSSDRCRNTNCGAGI